MKNLQTALISDRRRCRTRTKAVSVAPKQRQSCEIWLFLSKDFDLSCFVSEAAAAFSASFDCLVSLKFSGDPCCASHQIVPANSASVLSPHTVQSLNSLFGWWTIQIPPLRCDLPFICTPAFCTYCDQISLCKASRYDSSRCSWVCLLRVPACVCCVHACAQGDGSGTGIQMKEMRGTMTGVIHSSSIH